MHPVSLRRIVREDVGNTTNEKGTREVLEGSMRMHHRGMDTNGVDLPVSIYEGLGVLIDDC